MMPFGFLLPSQVARIAKAEPECRFEIKMASEERPGSPGNSRRVHRDEQMAILMRQGREWPVRAGDLVVRETTVPSSTFATCASGDAGYSHRASHGRHLRRADFAQTSQSVGADGHHQVPNRNIEEPCSQQVQSDADEPYRCDVAPQP